MPLLNLANVTEDGENKQKNSFYTGEHIMDKIIFATNNAHKLEEVNMISKDFGVIFEQPPANFNPEETGQTFSENSFIKATEASKLSNSYALADDSGLCVEALDGLPPRNQHCFNLIIQFIFFYIVNSIR